MSARGPHATSPRSASASSDAELMQQIATGELNGLGELYDRHQAPLRAFVARVTGDAEDVDDLVHATFLAAAKSAARYDGRASCRPWLMGIAVQLLRRRRRDTSRLLAVLDTLRSILRRTTEPDGVVPIRPDIERALARLSEPKRVTVLLAEVEGLSCAEIAEALGIPIGTVWTRLHAARRELRQALGAGEVSQS
ncbi:MAG TPA: RNA polymerase sigma factor [Polyangiaceae bacterium]|nr:RNA polymerase sigma factor [Polyangiaceae bacterium]